MLRFGVALSLAFISLMSRRLYAQDEGRPEFYTSHVKPVFDANCVRCHGGMNRKGGFNLSTQAGMMKGGRDGVVVVPGDPDKSLLIRLMRHEGPVNDPMPMPPNRPKVSDAEIEVVARWIKAGALMPPDVARP